MTVSSILRRDSILDAASYEAPRQGTEATLANLWAHSLRLDRVGRLDDFFELGGDSLAAASLFAGIHEAFGIELPTAFVLEASTIAQLAEVVVHPAASADGQARHLVTLQASRAESAPLVLVPPQRIQPLAYHNLLRALAYPGAIFLVNHPPLERMSEIARRHLQELASARLGPRVHLLGICWGSLPALEMAMLARDYGLRIGMLAIFDPPPRVTAAQRLRSRLRNLSPLTAAVINRADLYLSELATLEWRQRPRWLVRKLRALATRAVALTENADLEAEFMRLSPGHPLTKAGLTYRPRKPLVPVNLILASGRPDGGTRRGRPAWIQFLGAAERTYTVGGESTGEALLRAGAGELAGLIDRLLAAAG